LQSLSDNASDLRRGKGLGEAWDIGLLQKLSRCWAQRIACEQDHALEELWLTVLQLAVESWPIQLGHTEVAEHQIKNLFLKLCER
jgi:hypothetical protein